MQPTLDSGNIVLVNKLHKDYERLDIVIIELPEESIIKRIIGIPGDTIQIKDGYVSIISHIVPLHNLSRSPAYRAPFYYSREKILIQKAIPNKAHTVITKTNKSLTPKESQVFNLRLFLSLHKIQDIACNVLSCSLI